MITLLVTLLSIVWAGVSTPARWGHSVVVVLHKGTKSFLQPKNYRPMSLISITLKVMERILLTRMEGWLLTVVGRYQAGFRRGCHIVEHIMTIKVLAQQGRAGKVKTFACFIDLQSAYDLVPRDLLFRILEAYGLPSNITHIIRSIYRSVEFCVRVGVGASSVKSDTSRLERGLLQGSVLSPVLFNVFLQATIDEVSRGLDTAGITGGLTRVRHESSSELKWPPAGNHIGDILVRWLTYADDICILAESKSEPADILEVFNHVLTEHGMVLSAEKSFWMTLGCSVDQLDREAIQLPCGKIEYTVIQVHWCGIDL